LVRLWIRGSHGPGPLTHERGRVLGRAISVGPEKTPNAKRCQSRDGVFVTKAVGKGHIRGLTGGAR